MSVPSQEVVSLTLETPIEIVRELIASPEAFAGLNRPQLLTASEIAYRARDYALAITSMKRVVELAPREAAHHFRLGVIQKHAGDTRAAEKSLRESIELNPAGEAVYGELAALLAANRDTNGALAVLDAQDQTFGYSQPRLLWRVGLLRRSKRMAAALAALQPTLDADEVAPEVLRIAAEIALEMRRTDDAVAYARRLCTYAPESKPYRKLLAQSLCIARRFDEAIPLLEELIREDDTDLDALRLLSISFTETKRYHQALDTTRRTTELHPTSSEYWYRASALARILGHADEAVAWMARAIELDPENATLLISRAHLFSGLGRLEDAIASLDEAARLYPKDANIRDLKLMLLSRLKQDFVDPEAPSDRVKPLPKSQRVRPAHYAAEESSAFAQFLTGARIQCRVITALVMRDMANRTVHSKFGLISAVVEPLLQIVMLGIVLRIFNNGRPPLGDDLFFFYSTGVLPYYLFLHIADHTQNVYLSHGPILQVPRIKRVDLVISVAITELFIGAMTTALVFGLFFTFGYGEGFDNIEQAVFAYTAIFFFAFGVGMIGSVVNNLTKLWERSWVTVARSLYFLSGIFFIPRMMPDWARNVLVWNPLLVGIEWFRSGFFIGYSPPWIDKPYLISIALATIVVGFVLERGLRKRLRTTP